MIFNLGGFVFDSLTPLESMSINYDFAIKDSERLKNHKAFFATSKSSKTIEISGKTLPHSGSGNRSLDSLIELGDSQKAHTLTNGKGEFLGSFIIKSISENRSYFLDDGSFLAQEFSLNLEESF